MPVLPDWAIQTLQVVTILVLAPLVSGVIARVEAIVQQRRGPRVLQPYYDIPSCCARRPCCPGRRARCSAPRPTSASPARRRCRC